MTSSTIGLLAGAVLGLLNYGLLRLVAQHVETNGTSADQRRAASVIRVVAFVELMLLPIAGFYLGPVVLGS